MCSPPSHRMVGPTMNLISGTHHSCGGTHNSVRGDYSFICNPELWNNHSYILDTKNKIITLK